MFGRNIFDEKILDFWMNRNYNGENEYRRKLNEVVKQKFFRNDSDKDNLILYPLIFFPFIRKSPKDLVKKDNKNEAKKILKKILKIKDSYLNLVNEKYFWNSSYMESDTKYIDIFFSYVVNVVEKSILDKIDNIRKIMLKYYLVKMCSSFSSLFNNKDYSLEIFGSDFIFNYICFDRNFKLTITKDELLDLVVNFLNLNWKFDIDYIITNIKEKYLIPDLFRLPNFIKIVKCNTDSGISILINNGKDIRLFSSNEFIPKNFIKGLKENLTLSNTYNLIEEIKYFISKTNSNEDWSNLHFLCNFDSKTNELNPDWINSDRLRFSSDD